MTPLWGHQEAAVSFVQERWDRGLRGVLLAMMMGCIEGDAELIINRRGGAKRMTLRDFCHKFHGGESRWGSKSVAWDPLVESRVQSLIDGELRLNRILNVIPQGVRPVVRIRTASGKSLRVTPDHELAAPKDRWIAATDLKPGDSILINGTPVCRDCGSSRHVVHSRRATHIGLCRSCVVKRVKGGAGKIIDKDGYVRLYRMYNHARANKAGQVYEHIVVMEHELGRPITIDEHVHHKNEIRHDNDPKNLEVLSVPEHLRHHGKHGGYLHLNSAPHVCFIPKIDTVVSIEPAGETDVYDLQMAEPGHNFVANGIIVHNCGKSRVAIELALRNQLSPLLILAPLRVVEVWRTQFGLYAPEYDFLALDGRVSSVRRKTVAARDRLAWATAHKRPLAIAINWQSARLEPFAQWALANAWPLVIGDECVPPGTMIATPHGDVPIEELRVGDLVTGYDHKTQSLVATRIIATFHQKSTSPLIRIRNTRLTPEHPVWTTAAGYIPAQLISEKDEVVIHYGHTQEMDVSKKLRILQSKLLRHQTHSKILFEEMRVQSTRATPANGDNYARSAPQARNRHHDPGDADTPESLSASRDCGESQSKSKSNGLSHAERRVETADETTKITGFSTGVADGIPDPHSGAPTPLHDRYRQSRIENCDRSRRAWSSPSGDERTRPEERRPTAITGLAGVALLESRDPEESGRSGESRLVCNLETGTGNYFANNLLVHNCHKIKEPTGATSRFAGRLALRAHRRLGLTGTPMPHSPLDVWAQFRFLDRTLYDPTFTSFRMRYAITNPYFHSQVESWRDLDDLRRRFFSLSFQVGEEVLDLPEAHEQTLYCTLSAKGRETYNAMELEFVAQVGAHLVTASNALVRLIRLEQITSGVVKDTAGADCVVDTSKRQLLEDLLEDLPAEEPVVVFAHFKSDLAAVHEVARALGRASGEVSGDHSRRDDLARWQRGRENDPVILAVQIQAGEAGIDLTRARYGIYYSLDYNLGHYLQSRKRLHRHGQKWPVMFYHLMAADTIDQKVAGALERRQDLVESVLQEYQQCHQTTTS